MSKTGVFVVGDSGRHFHRTSTCWKIRSGQRGRTPDVMREVSLDDLTPRQSPCRTCYPDAPRVKVHTPYCHTCSSPKPCQHNGGVLVRVPRVWRYGAALIEPGEITYSTRYVWPSRAHRYQLVDHTSG